MPGNPKECREHAKRCWALASKTKNPVLKDSLVGLAQNWARLARELETNKRLLDALAKDLTMSPPIDLGAARSHEAYPQTARAVPASWAFYVPCVSSTTSESPSSVVTSHHVRGGRFYSPGETTAARTFQSLNLALALVELTPLRPGLFLWERLSAPSPNRHR